MRRTLLKRFRKDESGAILIEGALTFPVLLMVAFGMLEFGSILWQREQVQTGVRDAARYWSRCRQTAGAFNTGCSETIARNIAFYGTPNPGTNAPLRVPGWDGNPSTELELFPAKASLPANSSITTAVYATAQYDYQGFTSLINQTIFYQSEMRFIGW